MKYFIASISKEHTLLGLKDGFIQLCHGKKQPLKRMGKGDKIIVYSSKVKMNSKEKCQAFTAIGEVIDDIVYQYKMPEDFNPYRRNIKFFPSREQPIIPILANLSFIPNKQYWGYPFRYGFFEIKENDYKYLANLMLSNES